MPNDPRLANVVLLPTDQQRKTLVDLYRQGETPDAIQQATELNRVTVDHLLREWRESDRI